jgi:hypothetical protein
LDFRLYPAEPDWVELSNEIQRHTHHAYKVSARSLNGIDYPNTPPELKRSEMAHDGLTQNARKAQEIMTRQDHSVVA